MSFYLDASIVVPTLVDERASAAVDDFLTSADEPPIVSDMAALEVASALSRLVRMEILTREAAAALEKFDEWRAEATSDYALQPADFRTAGAFVRQFDLGLRAPDALHAAACRRGDHCLVTLDHRLATAAAKVGVRVEVLA